MRSSQRDLRLDLFRGLALIFIFVDHIPENVFSYFTLQAIAFYDAAEVFIFISGFTAALVYGRVLASKGWLYATAQVLRRTWQLYVAHIFLFMIFTAEVSYAVMTVNNPMYNEEMRVGDFLQEPHVAIIQALLLQFQPTFLDILPLYIVLLAAFPLMLIAMRVAPLLIVGPSFLLYVMVQVTGMAVPAYPEGHVWFFNPLAWQFLFVLGAALSHAAAQERLPWRFLRAILPVTVLIFALTTAIKLSWTIHGVWDGFPGLLLKELWPVNKNNLSALRLVPFLCTVLIVVVLVPAEAGFLRSRLLLPLVRCGQQSLEIFCLGIILSALGHFILSEYDSGMLVQVAVNVAGIAVMCLTARMIGWYKSMDRATSAPVAAGSAGSGGRRAET